MQRYRKVLALVLVVMMMLASAGCQKKEEVVATVGDAKITQADLEHWARLMQLENSQLKDVKQDAYADMFLEDLVNQEVLTQEAQRRDLKVDENIINANYTDYKDYLVAQVYGSEDELNKVLKQYDLTETYIKSAFRKKHLIDKLSEAVTKDVAVDEEEIQAYFDAHKEEFNQQEMVKARHILVKTEKEALDIRKQLEQGADFETLAKKHSIEPGAQQSGGDLGFFARQQMLPEFEEAAFSLPIGQISQPVKTKFGYHLIKVEEKKPAKEADYAQVDKESLKAMVLEEKKQKIFYEFFEKLKKDTKIDIKVKVKE